MDSAPSESDYTFSGASCSRPLLGRDPEAFAEGAAEVGGVGKSDVERDLGNGPRSFAQQARGVFETDVLDELVGRLPGGDLQFAVERRLAHVEPCAQVVDAEFRVGQPVEHQRHGPFEPLLVGIGVRDVDVREVDVYLVGLARFPCIVYEVADTQGQQREFERLDHIGVGPGPCNRVRGSCSPTARSSG